MNKDLITLNEVLNSGSSIDLYQEENTGLWATYGYSAYLLFHQNGIQCLANFSIHMQMPCVCITEADLKGWSPKIRRLSKPTTGITTYPPSPGSMPTPIEFR